MRQRHLTSRRDVQQFRKSQPCHGSRKGRSNPKLDVRRGDPEFEADPFEANAPARFDNADAGDDDDGLNDVLGRCLEADREHELAEIGEEQRADDGCGDAAAQAAADGIAADHDRRDGRQQIGHAAEHGRRQHIARQQHARRRITKAGKRVGRDAIAVERDAHGKRCIRIDAGRDEPPPDGRFLEDEDRDRGDDDHDVERQRDLEELADAELVERRRRLLREPAGDIHRDPQHQRIHADGGDQRVDAEQRDQQRRSPRRRQVPSRARAQRRPASRGPRPPNSAAPKR